MTWSDYKGREPVPPKQQEFGATEALSAKTSNGISGGGDVFDAQGLLRYLKEHAGYEIYELFERDDGTRIPSAHRSWNEALEDGRSPCSGAPAEPIAAPRASACGSQRGGWGIWGRPHSVTAAGSGAGATTMVDREPWVVLTPQVPPPGLVDALPKNAPPHQSKVGPPNSRGKAPPPPPHGSVAKAKAPPPPGKAPLAKAKGGAPKPKKAPPPPPFGKKLHWKLLPASSLEDTIFQEISPWDGVAPSLDTRQLERLFAPPPREKPAGAASTSLFASGASREGGGVGTGSDVAVPKAGGRRSALLKDLSQVCLLDPKRAQNLAIVLRQVTVPTEELAEVLRWMRLSHRVGADTLEHVHDNLLPPLLECAELLSYSGPPEMLRDVERQLLPLARLPRLKARIRTMLFSKNMPTHHSSLLARIHALRVTCEEVRESDALRRVLGAVLRVGNYLNHGIDLPDAGCGVEVRGFTVESLLKLRDFRAAQGGEGSALHCVVLHLMPGDAQLATRLHNELRGLGGDACIADGFVGDLRDAVGTFQSEIDLVQGEIERFGDCYRVDGEASECSGPLAVLERLNEDAQEMAGSLDAELSDALVASWRLMEFFGEGRGRDLPHPSSWSSETCEAAEKFFITMRDFMLSFEECWREVLEQPRRFRQDAGGTAAAAAATGAVAATAPSQPTPAPSGGAAYESPRPPAAPPVTARQPTGEQNSFASQRPGAIKPGTVAGFDDEPPPPTKLAKPAGAGGSEPDATKKNVACLAAEAAAMAFQRRSLRSTTTKATKDCGSMENST